MSLCPERETYWFFVSSVTLSYANVVSLLKTFKITQQSTSKYLREPEESTSETPNPSKLSSRERKGLVQSRTAGWHQDQGSIWEMGREGCQGPWTPRGLGLTLVLSPS